MRIALRPGLGGRLARHASSRSGRFTFDLTGLCVDFGATKQPSRFAPPAPNSMRAELDARRRCTVLNEFVGRCIQATERSGEAEVDADVSELYARSAVSAARAHQALLGPREEAGLHAPTWLLPMLQPPPLERPRGARLASEHLVQAQFQLSTVLAAAGRFEEARPWALASLADSRASLGDRHPATVKLIGHVGALELGRGRPAEAEPLLTEAAAAYVALYGHAHELTLAATFACADLLASRGKHGQAEPMLRANLAAARELHGPRGTPTIAALSNLAAVLLERAEQPAAGQPAAEYTAEALALLVELLGACERAYGPPAVSPHTRDAQVLFRHCCRAVRARR